MDPLSLFTGSDNLYKYLFLGGVGLIVLSLFYPLNKRFEYTTQKDLYNNEVKLLNHDINTLSQTVNELNASSVKINKELKNPHTPEQRKQAFKDSFSRQLDSVKSFRRNIEKKKLDVEYNKVRITTLEKHINAFLNYQVAFLLVGIIFTLSGSIGWLYIMKQYNRP